jgi:hypothetical protein
MYSIIKTNTTIVFVRLLSQLVVPCERRWKGMQVTKFATRKESFCKYLYIVFILVYRVNQLEFYSFYDKIIIFK